MKLFYVLTLSTFLIACYENKSCTESYIGKFYIDTTLIDHPEPKKYVKLFHWDTVLLLSTKDGTYTMNSNSKYLKDAEGSWYISSKNIDGDCFGFIKQKNTYNSSNKSPFNILIIINDSIRFELPFRKNKTK